MLWTNNWTNNPEIVRELHSERVRQVRQATRRPRLKMVAMEAEAEAASVVA